MINSFYRAFWYCILNSMRGPERLICAIRETAWYFYWYIHGPGPKSENFTHNPIKAFINQWNNPYDINQWNNPYD